MRLEPGGLRLESGGLSLEENDGKDEKDERD